MTFSECAWADWRGLIECEINKVSHSALQKRLLNDLYVEDHEGFDSLVVGMYFFLSFFFLSCQLLHNQTMHVVHDLCPHCCQYVVTVKCWAYREN